MTRGRVTEWYSLEPIPLREPSCRDLADAFDGTAYEACRTYPFGDIDICHTLCSRIIDAVVPAAAVAASVPTVITESHVSAGLDGRAWDPAARRRLVHVAFDACCHHLLPCEVRRTRCLMSSMRRGGARGRCHSEQ